MPALPPSLVRLPESGKFWLKRARIDRARPAGGSPAPALAGAAPLFDLRVEEGRIRAVLPAGEAPCCAPGLDLDGAAVRPLDGSGTIGEGQPADLSITWACGRRLELRGGKIAADTHATYDRP